ATDALRSWDLRLSDNLEFEFQRHPSPSLDRASDSPNQVEHVLSTGLPPVDHEIRVLGRDFDVSNASPLQADGLDESAGRILRWILKHPAGARQGGRLRIPPVVKVVLDNLFDLRPYALSQL